MIRSNVARLLAGFALTGCGGRLTSAHTTPAAAEAPVSVPVDKGLAAINGIRLYYELHGPSGGTPLVLLAGGGSTIESTYGHILPFFARHRRVLALDEQNHGRSEHRDVPERFTDSADDVAALLRHLGIPKADVMGFSNGASVAMQLAIRHSALVRKLIFAASMTKKSGASPQFWESIASGTFADMPQVLKDAFLAVNPDRAQLQDMYEKDAERMRNFVETRDDDVRSVRIPTLVAAGDRDVPTLEHLAELGRLMPRARVLILPGTHGELLGDVSAGSQGMHDPEISARLIEAFLDSPAP